MQKQQNVAKQLQNENKQKLDGKRVMNQLISCDQKWNGD